ncbi:alpha/beta hydrolase fold domain-containing protein [uncultured Draconibacterium sp.]|uniref:alpha/beta hydrolase fold domain-containing protein n=1 Tax=uncultured Draconibacterium sp. TaxID=1573823 RepID=UPI00321712EC
MKKTTSYIIMAIVLFLTNVDVSAVGSRTDKGQGEMYKVTLDAADHGSYSVSPKIPEDGKVEAGTEITITATPASGYSMDCIFKTVAGGMWGTTSYEYFVTEKKITVDKDMTVGATFFKSELVDNIEVTRDIVYAQPGVKKLKYDVYSPKGAKNLPIIVIIHGGGWSSNNEDIMRGLAFELLKGGQYVICSIDYRWNKNLDGDAVPNKVNNLIEDVYGAIAHIQEHASKYGGDATRIAVTGDSAGGHLSASAANMVEMIGDGGFGEKEGVFEYKPTYLPKGKSTEQVRNEIATAIKAAAPSYGVFRGSSMASFVDNLTAEQVKAIAPINSIPNVSDRNVPQFLVRGTSDPLISNEENQVYVDALKDAGQKVEYLQVEGASHAFFDWKPDARTRATFEKIGVPYAAKMKAFFDSVFFK